MLHRMRAMGGHQFVVDGVQLSDHAEQMQGLVHGSTQVTDMHIVLLAKSERLNVVTFDRGLSALAEALAVPAEVLTLS